MISFTIKSTTMKKLIVATDFSATALNAASYATDMASAIGGSISLLHVYQIPVSYSEVPVAMNTEELQQAAENETIKIKEALIKRSGGRIEIDTVVRSGSFFHELQHLCEEILPYTVVMGSQGTTAAQRFLFGGHAVHTMQHLEWPVITVPPTAKFSMIRKIGFACDFDKVMETTPVDEIKLLVNDFNASLHVLNTGKEGAYNADTVFESGMLQEMLAPLNPTYHLLSSEHVDEGIVSFADDNNIDLLLVLPKRHNLIEKLIHKSNTKQLVLHSHVPVMALHQ